MRNKQTFLVVLVQDVSFGSVSEDVGISWVSLVSFRTHVYRFMGHLYLQGTRQKDHVLTEGLE